MNIAICDCEIASEDFNRETNRGDINTATVNSDCDIASEGVQSDRRKINEIGGGFLRSEEGFMHQRRVLEIGGGFLLSFK